MKLFGLELFDVGQVSIINLISLTDTELFRILFFCQVMLWFSRHLFTSFLLSNLMIQGWL